MNQGVIKIFTDGGSRGNPGPAACAFVAFDKDKLVFKSSKYLGITTNNVAEYTGVLLALEWLQDGTNVEFNLDSELVAKQINGIYKIKDQKMIDMNQKIKNLISSKRLKTVFKNVPRESNKFADGLVNIELDRVQGLSGLET